MEVLFRGENDQQRVAQDEPAEVLGCPLEMVDDREGVVATATQDLHHSADFLNPGKGDQLPRENGNNSEFESSDWKKWTLSHLGVERDRQKSWFETRIYFRDLPFRELGRSSFNSSISGTKLGCIVWQLLYKAAASKMKLTALASKVAENMKPLKRSDQGSASKGVPTSAGAFLSLQRKVKINPVALSKSGQ